MEGRAAAVRVMVSELTGPLGHCFSVSLGSLWCSLSIWPFSVHLLCSSSIWSPFYTSSFLLTYYFNRLVPIKPLSPVFAQAFCYATHYHQWQFSSDSLCSNPRKNSASFLFPYTIDA